MQSKPVVSSRLPKAFTQPSKEEHHGSIKRALRKLKMLPIVVRADQPLDTVAKMQQNSPDFLAVSQARLEDVVTLRVLANSPRSGVTRKVLHALTLKLLAVREVPVNTRQSRERLVEWLAKWQILQRKNMQLLAVSSAHWNTPEGCVSVLLDYMNSGSVQTLMDKVGGLPEAVLANLACQALRAVGYLHKKGLVHGQLSASQLLLDSDGILKLGPGLSGRLAAEGREYTFQDDIAALGRILLAARLGGEDWFEVARTDACCLLDGLEELLVRTSAQLLDFLRKCLHPESRQPIEELLQHSWLYLDRYPGPRVSLCELLFMASRWDNAEGVTPVGESELQRVCNSLAMVLVGKRPGQLTDQWAAVLASDLGLSRTLVERQISHLLSKIQTS